MEVGFTREVFKKK